MLGNALAKDVGQGEAFPHTTQIFSLAVADAPTIAETILSKCCNIKFSEADSYSNQVVFRVLSQFQVFLQ